MLFVATNSVEQEVIVAAITVARFILHAFNCTYTCYTPTHVQSKPSSKFTLEHRLPFGSRPSGKFVAAKDVDLVLILSNSLTYVADTVNASVPQNAFKKYVGFMWVNAMKCHCCSIFVLFLQ